jgi:heme/copper-type cytochrome/quinol oxidase subunit 2
MFDNFPLWPTRASTGAGNVDALYTFRLLRSALMCATIFTMILVFALKYRRSRGIQAEQDRRLYRIGSNLVSLEFSW